MTSGQYRVLVLLIVLAFIEVATMPAVKDFFKSMYTLVGESVARNI